MRADRHEVRLFEIPAILKGRGKKFSELVKMKRDLGIMYLKQKSLTVNIYMYFFAELPL